MADTPFPDHDFLRQLTAIIEKNISNQQFGVSELADETNMSRSNLLRKVKKLTKLSVSQLISQVRLHKGMELLKKSALNVSEVSHQVGFSSTSYFIKCFREYYGYPPGEVAKRQAEALLQPDVTPIEEVSSGQLLDHQPVVSRTKYAVAGSVVIIVSLIIGFVAYYTFSFSGQAGVEKSIAVLPFKNDSNDSSNVYLINGLMESTVINLKKIKELSVVSRTSAEKYRNTSRSMPEVAKELNVNYVIEGSGQKIGDRILLNIQLIEARTDKHLWSKQYRRETKEIFDLQEEIAKNIAEEIQAIITPEEEESIEKKHTDDPVAYDFFLKGKDLFYKSTKESLEQSIPWFKKAIEQDQKFALPYANAAMVFYYLDVFQPEKKYAIEIASYADRAFSLDESLEESLIAKGLAHTHKKEFQQAIPYFEKALGQNPGSGLVLHFLTEFYSLHVPDAGMYLKYALKGVRADVASSDSVTVSFRYLQLSNALIEAGFIDEAVMYIRKSLDHNPDNFLARPLSVYIAYAKNNDLKAMRNFLRTEYNKDSSRLDIPLQLGLACYLMRDYKNAKRYYERFNALREVHPFDYFKKENLKIGNALIKAGYIDQSEKYIKSFKDFADQHQSKDKHWYLGMYYAHKGDIKKALEELNLFSKGGSCNYWVLLLDKRDPVFDAVKDNPEFKKIMDKIESDFWVNHKRLKTTLKENDLI